MCKKNVFFIIYLHFFDKKAVFFRPKKNKPAKKQT